jgi:hypothetical protein
MRQRRSLIVALVAGILAATTTLACHDQAATGPEVTGVQFAKPGPTDPEVTATDPPSAPQDTTLDIEVSGSGFDDGSTVELTLAGTPTEKVRTNSTRYRNSRKLIANVTIAADAEVDLYDVEVTTLRGKRGIGTEMFEVFTKNGGSMVEVQFRQEPSDALVDFFAGVTLDFHSARTMVEGRVNKWSLTTTLSDFELGVPRPEEVTDPDPFFDGKDPYNDPSCETDFLRTFLAEAADGSVLGQIRIEADWNRTYHIMGVAFEWDDGEGGYTYQLRVPSSGYDGLILSEGDHTILAARDGHFEIRRRDLGHSKTWFEMDRCSNTGDNGFINFEVWVWK